MLCLARVQIVATTSTVMVNDLLEGPDDGDRVPGSDLFNRYRLLDFQGVR